MKGTTMWTEKLKVAAVLAATLTGIWGGVPHARAASIEISGINTTQSNGVWDYAYSMTLGANNSLTANDTNGASQFTFFDVNGLTGSKASFKAGTTAATDWNVVVENTTGAWANNQSSTVSQGGTLVSPDLSLVPNVRFQYVGAGFSAGANPSAIGTAHLYSTNAPGLFGHFAARYVGLLGQTQVNSDSPTLPGNDSMQSVPLPQALWMGLVSIAGLGILNRVRRRSL
jgi:hypothetical protein